ETEAARAQAAQAEAEQLVKALELEQAAREQTNAAAQEADMRASALQRQQYDAQTLVVASLRDGLEHIAQGNLSHRIHTSFPQAYEPLRLDFNRAVATLGDVLRDVSRETSDLMGLVATVKSSANDLAQRTEAQVASLEITSHAVDTLNGAVRASTENAQSTAATADKVRAGAIAGGDIVHRVIAAMSGIETSSHEIAKINAVMDEIAFQTNLLALNAAVEAARAGEQGRGFAVVASEVRNLAQRSAEAAKEIKALIKDSVEKVDEGSRLVNESGETLSEIVGAVAQVNDIIAQIANASEEQAEGVDQVNQAITQMDQMTQQNAAMSEEATSASENMSRDADGLNRLIEFFRISNDQKLDHKSPASPRTTQTEVPMKRAVGDYRQAPESFEEDDWSEF
ncbi:MAG: methyl-accepting chemotaxis protein, partial [Pseudomonadota bacterium]